SDFTAVSGTLTFSPGQTTATIDVPIVRDSLSEPDETVNVALDSPDNATIADGNATGTIQDDDSAPTLTAHDASVIEGTGGPNTTLSLPVTLSAPSGRTVTVHYSVAGQSATAGSDFTAVSGTLT